MIAPVPVHCFSITFFKHFINNFIRATGFVRFNISIRVLISSAVHVILDNLFGHFNSKGGRGQLSTFIAEINAKYLLRHSAFSKSV